MYINTPLMKFRLQSHCGDLGHVNSPIIDPSFLGVERAIPVEIDRSGLPVSHELSAQVDQLAQA